MSILSQSGADVFLRVFAKPRASKSRVLAARADDELEVAISAPPVDGAANTELQKLIAKACKLSKGRVTLEKGETSRHKLLRLRDVEVEQVRRLLGL